MEGSLGAAELRSVLRACVNVQLPCRLVQSPRSLGQRRALLPSRLSVSRDWESIDLDTRRGLLRGAEKGEGESIGEWELCVHMKREIF